MTVTGMFLTLYPDMGRRLSLLNPVIAHLLFSTMYPQQRDVSATEDRLVRPMLSYSEIVSHGLSMFF